MDILKTYKSPAEELSEVSLGDKRLNKRLTKSVDLLTQNSESSILGACGSKHDAKSLYAMLSNDKFSHEKVVSAAKQATSERIAASGLREVLLVQDTTDVVLNGHKKTEGLGNCGNLTSKGVQVHSCIAVSPCGAPLGFVAQQYFTRLGEKSKLTKNQKQNLPIEEKESYRWLTTTEEALKEVPEGIAPIIVCDREGDFYELFEEIMSFDADFVIRAAQNRTTKDNEKVIQRLRKTKACGEVEVTIPRDSRKNRPARKATIEIAYSRITITKPQTIKTDFTTELTLTFLRATEIGNKTDDPVEWILVTNMDISCPENAVKVFSFYVHRWKIERFHYILKSGCNVEKIQQRTYERILPLITIYSVISLYLLALTYFARLFPDAPCDTFLEEDEWKILYCIINKTKTAPHRPFTLKVAVDYLGQLGSYKHSPCDGVYGVKSVWKGCAKLFDAVTIANLFMG